MSTSQLGTYKCSCGSGKQYRKCHLGRKYSPYENSNVPIDVIEAANKFSKPPLESFEKDGSLVGRPFIDTTYKGKRARAVGEAVHLRPIDEPFHQFILDLFGNAIGYDWVAKERVKEEKNRHTLSLWGQEMVEMIIQAKAQQGPRKLFKVKQTGNMRALLAMAYDYYSLSHCSAKIQPQFIKKLKNKDEFQGTRYEMAVAGIAVRAGFDITWINEKGKHCEFIGKHKQTGEIVYFECKSHTREGVLGKNGAFDPEKTRIKILDHFREAVEQTDKKYPLVIFDDINLPMTPDVDPEQREWHLQVEEAFEKYGFYKDKKYKETNYGALIITNFSWHYHQDLSQLKENELITYFHINGKYSLKPETVALLKSGAEQYGFVPPRLDEV